MRTSTIVHHVNRYLVHGNIPLIVKSSSLELLDYARRCLMQVSEPLKYRSQGSFSEVELVLTKETYPVRSTKCDAESHGEIETDGSANQFHDDSFIVCSRQAAFVKYSPSTRKAYASFSGNSLAYYMASTCLIPVLNLVLKEASFFLIHAAAVSHSGIGLLLAAPSGVGKSTTLALLARAGFSILHDDMIWVQPQGPSSSLFSAPGPIRLKQDMLRILELETDEQEYGEVCEVEKDPVGKYIFFAQELKSFSSVPSTRCGGVCFLERSRGESSFQRIGSSEAIERLTKQSFLASEPSATAEYLRVLVNLVEGVPQYLVSLGADFHLIPDVFHRIIEYSAVDGNS